MVHQSNRETHIQTYRPTSVKVSCYSEVSTTYLSGHFLATIINFQAVDFDLKQEELKKMHSFPSRIQVEFKRSQRVLSSRIHIWYHLWLF